AVTRTEQTLLLSGHRWPDTGKAKTPSVFLEEAREVLEAGAGSVEHWASEPEEDENPLSAEPRTAQWPIDPLGDRRGLVEEGARMVLDEIDLADEEPPPGPVGPSGTGDRAEPEDP